MVVRNSPSLSILPSSDVTLFSLANRLRMSHLDQISSPSSMSTQSPLFLHLGVVVLPKHWLDSLLICPSVRDDVSLLRSFCESGIPLIPRSLVSSVQGHFRTPIFVILHVTEDTTVLYCIEGDCFRSGTSLRPLLFQIF